MNTKTVADAIARIISDTFVDMPGMAPGIFDTSLSIDEIGVNFVPLLKGF
jgi:hypothetical protein